MKAWRHGKPDQRAILRFIAALRAALAAATILNAIRQSLEMRTLLFKTGCNLLACRSVDAFVRNLAFPLLQKEVSFTQ